jgi:hypothetical protein
MIYTFIAAFRGSSAISITMLVSIWLTISADFRPKRLLEQIKGISEQKATKILVEGNPPCRTDTD